MAFSSENLDQLLTNSVTLLTALASNRRIEILEILLEGEVSVGKLGTRIGLSQSALSQQLAKLRQAKIVKTRRQGQTVFYSCTSIEVAKVLECLRDIVSEQITRPKMIH